MLSGKKFVLLRLPHDAIKFCGPLKVRQLTDPSYAIRTVTNPLMPLPGRRLANVIMAHDCKIKSNTFELSLQGVSASFP
jgi:hypothetical protein